MKTPPSPSRLRVTVPVTLETLEAFQHLAEAQRVSVGRAMGDWLGDQLPAVTFLALQLEQVLDAPRELSEQLLPPAAAGGAQRPQRASAAVVPPRPVIRGGKSPRKGAM